MRTYTHGVIGYLLYAKRPRQEKTLAVMGGILPDVFLVLGFMPHYQTMAEDHTHKSVGECHPYREFEGMPPSR